MSRYHDDRTSASNPGGVRLSRSRLHRIWPLAPGLIGRLSRFRGSSRQFEEMLDEHLRYGDARAAVVMSIDPLLVAAYSDDLDCVAMLQFPTSLAAMHGLSVGSRLLTINTYHPGHEVAQDLRPGPARSDMWVNVYPVIAEFLSDELQRIESKKHDIDEVEWERCLMLGTQYLSSPPVRVRDGSPYLSMNSA